tara:strand:- start:55 stop:558 length:504 start_codon:yes stop_codon:yes gene_type:complete
VTANDDIIFSVNDIVCTDGFHEYNGYYSSPCYKWKTEMQRDHCNTVRCTIVQNNLGEKITGCNPAFGGYDDRFIVDYEVTKLKNNESCSNVQYYTATAVATHYGVLHPITNIIVTLLAVALFVYQCTRDHSSSYSSSFMGSYLGTSTGSYRYRNMYSSSRTSWSRMR